jgi:hypothetical protein
MKQENHYSRKRRQLSVLANRLQFLLSNYKEEVRLEIENLILKIKRLINDLALVVSKPSLAKALGATAFIFGISFTNQSSAQNFATPQTNPFNLVNTYQLAAPTFADLDNDGDMDLIAGEYYGALKYFKNVGTNTNPSFAAPITNPFGLDSTYFLAFPTFVDLDNDGDLDLLVGQSGGDFAYFQNTGTASSPQFDTAQINPFGLDSISYFSIPTFADLDGDGDLDLLAGEYYGALKYFKNIGTATAPQFAAQQSNPFGLTSTYYIAAPDFADIDGDGDLDLFVGEYYGAIQYFKNIGTSSNPQFDTPQKNPFGLTSVNKYGFPAFVDLDGDGDSDLMVGESNGSFQYFKNISTSIGILELDNSDNLNIYPNPVNNILFIDSKEQFDKVEIFNTLGELIKVVNSSDNKISVSDLSPGIYTIAISSDNGFYTVKRLVKE